MISRCLAWLSCVYPHVRLRCPESSRSELHWRSIGAEEGVANDAGWILIVTKMVCTKMDFHRFGLVSLADHLEGVRRLPNNSQKTERFWSQKEQAQ